MPFELYPIAITKGEYSQLIKVCKDILGYSPTRGLDQSHLKIDDPAAFLAVLKLDNAPLDTLRHGRHNSSLFAHFSASFVAVLDDETIIDMGNLTRLKTFSKRGRRESVVIISGTLDEWYDAIVNGCREESSFEIRQLFNMTLSYFDRVGFREIFNSLKRRKLLDGTFVCQS